MWRSWLVNALTTYRHRYPEETTTIEAMMEFIMDEPGCFDRTTIKGHLTGSAWLVDPSHQSVLLTHHRKLNRWLQLGGHADGEGNLLAVALTEAREESGIDHVVPISAEIFDVDIHPIPARGQDPEHLHYDVRFLVQAMHTQHVVSEESHDLAWVHADAIDTYTTEPSMQRMSMKWRHLLGSSHV
jgi:8-oxo-dGTP pyrophosphatase MutT (NUDIX family)